MLSSAGTFDVTPPTRTPGPLLSLVLPTFVEADNLPVVVPLALEALRGIPHEVLVVDDDSPDGTWRVALGLARRHEAVRVLRRVGRRGLSSAVVEGFLAARGDVLAVADADGQHDFALLPRLYEAVRGGAHLALGSRYAAGGSVGEWDERRYALSRLATRLAVRLCRVPVADPMSGFFAVDRATFEATLPRLNPKGFKILLDLLVHAPAGLLVRELPFAFGPRLRGESKLSRRVQVEFLEYLYDVVAGRFVSLTFVKYCAVGSLGVGVNALAYYLISRLLLPAGGPSFLGFSLAVVGAIETAIVFNFVLNNLWTYAHARLRGLAALLGLARYNGTCFVGALANYGASAFLFGRGWPEAACVLGGAALGAVWNYTMSRLLTWPD
jgi:dolichol-phosphate mannosyltransferase